MTFFSPYKTKEKGKIVQNLTFMVYGLLDWVNDVF